MAQCKSLLIICPKLAFRVIASIRSLNAPLKDLSHPVGWLAHFFCQRPPDRSAVPNKKGTDVNNLNKEDTTTLFHSHVSENLKLLVPNLQEVRVDVNGR